MMKYQKQIKILLLVICFLLLLSGCSTIEYVYVDPPLIDYPDIPSVPDLILEPTTKEDYRYNTVQLATYAKELQSYIDLIIKKDDAEVIPLTSSSNI